jgi:hypothetical protein
VDATDGSVRLAVGKRLYHASVTGAWLATRTLPDTIVDLAFDGHRRLLWAATHCRLYAYNPAGNQVKTLGLDVAPSRPTRRATSGSPPAGTCAATTRRAGSSPRPVSPASAASTATGPGGSGPPPRTRLPHRGLGPGRRLPDAAAARARRGRRVQPHPGDDGRHLARALLAPGGGIPLARRSRRPHAADVPRSRVGVAARRPCRHRVLPFA